MLIYTKKLKRMNIVGEFTKTFHHLEYIIFPFIKIELLGIALELHWKCKGQKRGRSGFDNLCFAGGYSSRLHNKDGL